MNLPSPYAPPPPVVAPSNNRPAVAAPSSVPANVVSPSAPHKINARSKGQRGEREVIKRLQGLVDAARVYNRLPPLLLQRNTLQAHTGGDDLVGFAKFSIEVKRHEKDYDDAWWRQAVRQAGATKIPVLFYRRNGRTWSVKVRLTICLPGCRPFARQSDCTMSIDDFIPWFCAAYHEMCVDEASGRS